MIPFSYASCGPGSLIMTALCSCCSTTTQVVKLGQKCSRTWNRPQLNMFWTWVSSQFCHTQILTADSSSVWGQVDVVSSAFRKHFQPIWSNFAVSLSITHACSRLSSYTGRWKPNDYPFVDNVRAIYLTLEKLIQPEVTQVNGIVILADYTGVGMSQASNPGPFLAKKVVSILQVSWELTHLYLPQMMRICSGLLKQKALFH